MTIKRRMKLILLSCMPTVATEAGKSPVICESMLTIRQHLLQCVDEPLPGTIDKSAWELEGSDLLQGY